MTPSSRTLQLKHIQMLQGKSRRPEFNSLFRTRQEMRCRAPRPSPVHLNPGASHFQQVPLLPKKGRKSMEFSSKEGSHNESQASTQGGRRACHHPENQPAWFLRPRVFAVHTDHDDGTRASNWVSELPKIRFPQKDPYLLFPPLGCLRGVKQSFCNRRITSRARIFPVDVLAALYSGLVPESSGHRGHGNFWSWGVNHLEEPPGDVCTAAHT